MKKLLLTFCSLAYTISAFSQMGPLINPSFEGNAQPHMVPDPWDECYGSPDTQPGTWGITLPPSEGNTYVSFLMQGNNNGTDYYEGATQPLTSCLLAGVSYTLTLDAAFSSHYQTAEPDGCYGSLAIWGGNTSCGQDELLWHVGPITDTTWQTFTATFTPTQDWCNLSFSPYFITQCNGYINILIDNIRDFGLIDSTSVTTIAGKAYYDTDTDCNFDNSGDYPLPYKVVNLQPANRYAITNLGGDYTIVVPVTTTGNQALDLNLNNIPYYAVCPTDTNGYQVALNGTSQNLSGYDFSVSTNEEPCTQVGLSSYAQAYRPVLHATRWVNVTNYSNVPLVNPIVTVNYTDTLVRPLTNLNIPYPYTINDNLLTINLPTMVYGQIIQFSYLEDVNDFVVGDVGLYATVDLSVAPANTCNNEIPGGYTDHYTDTKLITNSYDPNDKQAVPIGYSEQHSILRTDDIEYTIRFQNTGTDTAFTVKVVDTLSTYFDVSTLNLGVSTHPFAVELVNSNVLIYTFNNIMLPPASTDELGSSGAFKYKIAQKTSNPITYYIENTANIYFDLNPPIITNTVFHNVKDTITSITENAKGNVTVDLYPNPATNSITMQLSTLKGEFDVALYNASGQLVKQLTGLNKPITIIDVSTFASGLYYYRLTNINGNTAAGRFVKE